MAAPSTAFPLALGCAVGLGFLGAGFAASAGPIEFREAMLGDTVGRPATPVIGRYQTDEGRAFVLDRSSARVLLKFDGNPEIWVLQAAPGPRGDVIYRNDLGEEMLRATRIGGMTVFTQKRPDGSAAAFFGASPPLRIPQLSPEGLENRFLDASTRASRAAQHQIEFETGKDAEAETASAFADAATVAGYALVEMAARPENRAAMATIADVVITQGARPAVALRKGVLTVTINPRQGLSGRPSSRLIEHAAGAR
jgi:hypothetical protein